MIGMIIMDGSLLVSGWRSMAGSVPILPASIVGPLAAFVSLLRESNIVDRPMLVVLDGSRLTIEQRDAIVNGCTSRGLPWPVMPLVPWPVMPTRGPMPRMLGMLEGEYLYLSESEGTSFPKYQLQCWTDQTLHAVFVDVLNNSRRSL